MAWAVEEAAHRESSYSLQGNLAKSEDTISRSQASAPRRDGSYSHTARRTYWLKKLKQDEGPESFMEQALRTITRVSTLMTTPQQVQRELFKGLIYRYFSEKAILLIEKCQEESLYRMSQEIVQLWQPKDGYARKKFMLMETPQTQLQQRRRDGGHYQGGNRWNKETLPTTTSNEGGSLIIREELGVSRMGETGVAKGVTGCLITRVHRIEGLWFVITVRSQATYVMIVLIPRLGSLGSHPQEG